MKIICDQKDWGKLRLSGGDRERFLQGMVTNDVAALAPGGFCRAAILNVKGRVLAVVDVVREDQSFLLLSEPLLTAKVRQVLEKHAIVDDVAFEDVGLPCHRVWDQPASVWGALPVFSTAEGSSAAEVEARRVEGGLPRYGADVSEDHFPFEAHLDGAISYSKGCYIGQEVVARAHARGHANKRLMGLRLEAPAAAGSVVSTETRPDAGVVTSSVVSPLFGAIALAYIHKSAWEPGTRVTVGGGAAVVSALPFA